MLLSPNFLYHRSVGANSSRNEFQAVTNNYRVQELSNTGTFIRIRGLQGTGDGQFNAQ